MDVVRFSEAEIALKTGLILAREVRWQRARGPVAILRGWLAESERLEGRPLERCKGKEREVRWQ
jgi:hypothetical protein